MGRTWILIPGVLLALQMAAAGDDRILIHGDNGTETSTSAGMTTYVSPAFELTSPVICQSTDDYSGQWVARVNRPGLYTAAIEEAYGFGPAVRPGITVSAEGFNRASLTLPFAYDFLGGSQLSEDAHREFGQTFVAAGTAITAIVFAEADSVRISMHEHDASGRQIGATVQADSFYPPEALPTVPGQRYYLRFFRDDGAAFRMPVTPDDRYHDGNAYLDGQSQHTVDLALRIQHSPEGQILRHKPGMTEVLPGAEKSFGQTFIAKGTGLAMLSVFPSGSSPSGDEVALRLYEEGPGGRPITPAIASRVLVFGPGQLNLTPGKRYYIEATGPSADAEISMWVSLKDDFAGGQLYRGDKPVADRDLAMILVEYEKDTLAPSQPTPPSYRRGMPWYAQRLTADGKARIIWDVPRDNDIAKVVIRRRVRDGRDSEEEAIAEMPVSAAGRYQYVDAKLISGVRYDYTIRTVDVAGNESEALQAPAVPLQGLPMSPHVLNADFTGPHQSYLPYGWMVRTIAGAVPSLRTGFSHKLGHSLPAAGWEVPEGVGSTDTVLYQHVPCEPGRRYRLAAAMYQWNPWNSPPMLVCAAVGIDPHGGEDPLAESVIWSPGTFEREQWFQVSTAATAESERMTIYLRGYAAYSRLINVRFRNVRLTDITQGESTGALRLPAPD